MADPGRGEQFQRRLPRPEASGQGHSQRGAQKGQGGEEVCALVADAAPSRSPLSGVLGMLT
eukprot:11205315-Lingulodinium_polyedra.AAC.1